MDRERIFAVSVPSDAARPPTREFLQHVERQAMEIRRRAGVKGLDPLDQQALADHLGLKIITPEGVVGMTPEHRSQVRAVTPKQWSGTGMPLPNGRLLVMLNSEQTPERANVTTMEEFAHAYYGHQPTRIVALPNGAAKRSFNPRNEQEAYWTAAAALLPMKAVGRAIMRGQTAGELAGAYGVSIELAEFRIKILRLWPYYNGRTA